MKEREKGTELDGWGSGMREIRGGRAGWKEGWDEGERRKAELDGWGSGVRESGVGRD